MVISPLVFDSKGLYGSDENSMKSGAHDLKGLIALRQADIPQFHLPLMALVGMPYSNCGIHNVIDCEDYRGFRVVAISLMPIGKDETLAYGSNNGKKFDERDVWMFASL